VEDQKEVKTRKKEKEKRCKHCCSHNKRLCSCSNCQSDKYTREVKYEETCNLYR